MDKYQISKIKYQNDRSKFKSIKLRGILLVALCGLLCGCAALKEGTKCVLGVSTKTLEDSRKDALTKSFAYDYQSAFAKALGALKAMNTYVYCKDSGRKMIAFYVSEQDTTPVGVFFKTVDNANTQVEVSSPSTYAKELIAKRLFARLAGLPDPEEKTQEPKPLEKTP